MRDPGVVSRDLFNIEQIEVAKGPASAITGRGSTGGAINLASKMARAGDFARLDATAGTDNYARGTFDLSTDVGEHSAFRLNGMWQHADVPGRDVAERNSWGIAPSFAFGLGSATRVWLNAIHVSQDNVPDYGLPVTLPASVPAGTTPADLDWSNFYGLRDRDYEKVESSSGTIIIEHDFSETLSLRNLTRYGVNDRDAIVTAPRAATLASQGTGWLPGMPQIRRNDMKSQDREDAIFANQTSLSVAFDTGAVRHDFVAGVELSREKQDSYARAEFSTTPPPFADLFDPDPSQTYPTSDIRRNGASTHAEADTVAVFAFDTLHLNDQWQLSGGLRWERFDVDYLNIAVRCRRRPAASRPASIAATTCSAGAPAWSTSRPATARSTWRSAPPSIRPPTATRASCWAAAASTAPRWNRSARAPSNSAPSGSSCVGRLNFTGALFQSEKTNARATDGARQHRAGRQPGSRASS